MSENIQVFPHKCVFLPIFDYNVREYSGFSIKSMRFINPPSSLCFFKVTMALIRLHTKQRKPSENISRRKNITTTNKCGNNNKSQNNHNNISFYISRQVKCCKQTSALDVATQWACEELLQRWACCITTTVSSILLHR